jgi:superfamily I DNA/RNA helicase
LALTFIRNLVRDLKVDLSGLAEVFTFHGFCTHLLHRTGADGITSEFDFYPSLPVLVAKDVEALGGEATSKDAIEGRFHDLDSSDGLIDGAVRIGDYYDAVSFIDVVYRVRQHLEESPDEIPVYPLVVVDEYQDFSLLETRLIGQLASRSPVLVAGDDDQALYTFKHASAIYIRELATDPEYESFELPFCSRCPEVIVEAVQRIVALAQKNGKVVGRLARSYQCFLPEKGTDSGRHPKIILANCSVENKRAPYVCRYVAEEITRIPPEDIEESHEKKYPTVLVIGPGQFMRRVHQFLRDGPFPNAELREREEPAIDLWDGYQRIAKHNNSRLGWRIAIHAEPFPGCENIGAKAIQDGTDLINGLPEEYRTRPPAERHTCRPTTRRRRTR